MSDSKGKDTLMKMLLSTGPSAGGSVPLPPPPPPPPPGPPRYSTPTSSIPSPSSDTVEDTCPTLGTYLNQVGIAGQNNGFSSWNKVYLDHNYAKPGSESYNHGYMKPTKTLFINKPNNFGFSTDEVIEVDVDSPQSKPPYDLSKAQEAMEECEKYVAQSKNTENEPADWEESVSKTGWSTPQTNLFNRVVKILQNDRLARLANSDCRNEPVLRRICIDKSAQRFREAMASVMWDVKLTRWLHSLLIENLTTSYLAAYLEILQTLRKRIPALVDKMVGANNQIVKGVEGLNPLMKPPWDPVGPSIAQHKLKKLPGNPVIIMVPSRKKKQSMSHRAKLWHSHLSDLGTVVTVSSSLYNVGTKLTTQAYLAQLVPAIKGRFAEVRMEYPRRPIILIGWRSAAALACQIAVTVPVSAVVCLGFASSTVEGHRGEPDDYLLDVRCPVLFVVGENAATARQEDLEEIREKMRYQTDLLVVGYADDYLRMGKSKKRMEGVTQSMVDRCILEEIGDFLAGVLISPKPAIMANDFKREIYGRRRHNSTTSSVDSESSAAKRSRPGTPQPQVPMNATSTPKPSLNVAQVNGNLKVSPAKPLPRGRRPGSGKKASKLLMSSTLQTNTLNQVN
ncbi:UNVERIFIED_CONTAM: hypothetical protein PYX00_007454 [Menopon gallinae]|uniref:KANSL3 helical domain-containing protein n=1 Tax=Menopon gallinae TaxID=328185 RepID=A0AAW2HJF3_9NEOP